MVYGISVEKTTLYLTPDLQRELVATARREGRPQAAIVRDALERYMATAPRGLPPSVGAVDTCPDDGVDASNVKAWMRERWAAEERATYGRPAEDAGETRADG